MVRTGYTVTSMRITNSSKDAALKVIAHPKKVDAIAATAELMSTAELMRSMGFEEFKRQYLRDLASLAMLPFMDPVIRFHLARNLGVDWDVAKPDLWLVRAAGTFDYEETAAGAQALCVDLAREVGLRIGTIDLILWRYLRANGNDRTLGVQLLSSEGSSGSSSEVTRFWRSC